MIGSSAPLAPAVVVTSFGYGHAAPPEAEVTLDVRTSLRDPHVSPVMRAMTGLDRTVLDHVLATPGARGLVTGIAATVRGLVADLGTDRGPVRVAVGCVGGRHRSVALARALADQLTAGGPPLPVAVVHRDVHRPVLTTARR